MLDIINKHELKQKVSELFSHTRKDGVSSQNIRDLIDEYIPDEKPLSEKEKAIECIKALSRIDGYMMTIDKNTGAVANNIDFIMNYFSHLLKELDKWKNKTKNLVENI